MADLTVVASVTRATGGALSLEVPGTYRVVEAGPGALSWRRELATSPFVHGAALVSAVKDLGLAPLTVRVIGTSAATLESRTNTLLRAFEQFSYQLTVSIDGVAHTWACQPADYAPVDGMYDPHFLRALQQVYRFQIPRHPVPVAGSM